MANQQLPMSGFFQCSHPYSSPPSMIFRLELLRQIWELAATELEKEKLNIFLFFFYRKRKAQYWGDKFCIDTKLRHGPFSKSNGQIKVIIRLNF